MPATTNAVIVSLRHTDKGSVEYTVKCKDDGQTYTRADSNLWSALYGAGVDVANVGKTPIRVCIPCEWDGRRVCNIPTRLRYEDMPVPAQRVKVIDVPRTQTTHVSVWLVVAALLVVGWCGRL